MSDRSYDVEKHVRSMHQIERTRSNTIVYYALCSCGWRSAPSNIESWPAADAEAHIRGEIRQLKGDA